MARPPLRVEPSIIEPRKSHIGLLFAIIVIVIIFAILSMSVSIVGPGERGVLLRWGAVTGDVFNEGLNFKIPFIDSVDIMDVKTLKLETDASSASKDLQIVTARIALNYRLKPESVVYVRQNIGKDYQYKIVDPAIQEAIKASTAQFTAEELITKRPLVREQMKVTLQDKLDTLTHSSIMVEEFNVINFDFSSEFNRAIESKVTAEQLALKAQRDLERIKIEAQQKIEQAKAEAESLRIQSAALQENPDILRLRWIEKWDGKLPQFLSGDDQSILLSLPTTE